MTRSQDDTPRTWGQALWQVQPRWLRMLAVIVVLPSWLVMGFFILQGNTESRAFMAAVVAFVVIGGLELAFVAKAYWKNEI